METFSPSHPMDNAGYLEGQLLVATPLIQGPCFGRSVIYLCAHSPEGAMGIIVNHYINNLTFGEVFKQLSIDSTEPLLVDRSVHFGGPVEAGRGFVIHSPDYEKGETLEMPGGIALTSNLQVLRDIAHGSGPEKTLLALGYAGWGPGQLEEEIAANSWVSLPADAALIFDTADDQKWHKASQSLGFDMMHFSLHAGHA